MKKILKTLVCSALLLGGVVSIAGCNNNTSQLSSKASTSSMLKEQNMNLIQLMDMLNP